LGLALTKRLTEAQGGWVDVRSVSGRGSTFSAILPCVTRIAGGLEGAIHDQPPSGQGANPSQSAAD
jgi:chemotaxis protein histidine kinase CheA